MAKQVPPPPAPSAVENETKTAVTTENVATPPGEDPVQLRRELEDLKTLQASTKEKLTQAETKVVDLERQLSLASGSRTSIGDLNEHPLFQLFVANMHCVNAPNPEEVLRRAREQMEFFAKQATA